METLIQFMNQWSSALCDGLLNWCDLIDCESTEIITFQRLRPRCPILVLSGATPGPFYHSHPHISKEFDCVSFELEDQIRANIGTIRRIARAATGANAPVEPQKNSQFFKQPLTIHWVSGNGSGHSSNIKTVEQVAPQAWKDEGMTGEKTLAIYRTGGNVSDRRFLLESFAMFGLTDSEPGDTKACTRIDLWDEFDSVDGDIYNVKGKKYFMPYVPGYLISGPTDLALFSIAAGTRAEEPALPAEEQITATVRQLLQALRSMNCEFADVALLWNRCMNLDKNENAILTVRSTFGLRRPLAESVLEVDASNDPNPCGSDGEPVALEYIVLAQIPRQSQY